MLSFPTFLLNITLTAFILLSCNCALPTFKPTFKPTYKQTYKPSAGCCVVGTDDYYGFCSGYSGIQTVTEFGDILSTYFDQQTLLNSEIINCPNCISAVLPQSASVIPNQIYQSGNGFFDPLGGVTQAVSSAVGGVLSGLNVVSVAVGSFEHVMTGPLSDFAGDAVAQFTQSQMLGALAQQGTQYFASRVLESILCLECTFVLKAGNAVKRYNDDVNKGYSTTKTILDVGLSVVPYGSVIANLITPYLPLRRKAIYMSGSNSNLLHTSGTTRTGIFLSLNATYSLELFKLATDGKINSTLALQEHISKMYQNVSLVQSAFKSAAKRLLTYGYVDSDGKVVIPNNSILQGLATGTTTVESSGAKQSFLSVNSTVRSLRLNYVSAQYSSTFDPKTTSGASGSFSMLISTSGRASYQWSIDLANFKFPSNCNSTIIKKYGLNFGIYTSPLDAAVSALSSVGCTNCRGRYDPYLACSAASEFSTSLCKSLPKKTYDCSKTTFSLNGLSEYCEVGDLSGKFGAILPNTLNSNGTTVLKFFGSILNDPNPPLTNNYYNSDLRSNGWTTLALSCPIIPKGKTSAPVLLSALIIGLPNTSYVTPTLPENLVTKFSGLYNATIRPEEANGATGLFTIKIDNQGRGTYNYSISLAQFLFPNDCSIFEVMVYGLKYRIHSNWDESKVNGRSSMAGFCDHCEGTYDPYLGCSPLSYNSTQCAKLGRIVKVDSPYKYM